MPVTWCYDVEDEQKFCNPGFPIGCYVTETGQPKDACVVNVSSFDIDANIKLLAHKEMLLFFSRSHRSARVVNHVAGNKVLSAHEPSVSL